MDPCVHAPVDNVESTAIVLDAGGEGYVVCGLHAEVLKTIRCLIRGAAHQVEAAGPESNLARGIPDLGRIRQNDEASQEHGPGAVHQETAGTKRRHQCQLIDTGGLAVADRSTNSAGVHDYVTVGEEQPFPGGRLAAFLQGMHLAEPPSR